MDRKSRRISRDRRTQETWRFACLATILGCTALAQAGPTLASGSGTEDEQPVKLYAGQLLTLAEKAQARGDAATAEAAYRALFADPSVEIRSEARFRLADLMVKQQRLPEAATLLREILDEQPQAQRVRLELAQLLDRMGDETGARRALREAQAGGLPPDVALMVDRYSVALRARKPLGASIDIALAPDSNVNRATGATTLKTVLGDFILEEGAKQRSGIGLALRGQVYARIPLNEAVNLFSRISGYADLYRDAEFNDVALAATLGPEVRTGADRFSLETGGYWRWFGTAPYSSAMTLGLNYFHPLGRSAQLRGTASLAFVDNHVNSLQDGRTYSASVSYERALSAYKGIGGTLLVDRQVLIDPGYSNWAWQATVYAYRDFGPVTVVPTVSYTRLKADARLLLFPELRSDRLLRVGVSGTFRNLRLGAIAPFVRATYEDNRSNSAIYDYGKLRMEIGLTRAF